MQGLCFKTFLLFLLQNYNMQNVNKWKRKIVLSSQIKVYFTSVFLICSALFAPSKNNLFKLDMESYTFETAVNAEAAW